jgi:hypothetical protein
VGTYVFRLTVTDGLLFDDDTVTVVVEEGIPGGGGNTGNAPENLRVIPNRANVEDLSTVKVVGPAALAGKVLVYGVSGDVVAMIELAEDGNSAIATLDALTAQPGLYIFVAEGKKDFVARLVVTP